MRLLLRGPPFAHHFPREKLREAGPGPEQGQQGAMWLRPRARPGRSPGLSRPDKREELLDIKVCNRVFV